LTYSSWTSRIWTGLSLLVINHSSPAILFFPYTSTKSLTALIYKLNLSVKIIPVLLPSTYSYTLGKYEPTVLIKYDCPIFLATLLLSVKS